MSGDADDQRSRRPSVAASSSVPPPAATLRRPPPPPPPRKSVGRQPSSRRTLKMGCADMAGSTERRRRQKCNAY
jgi:hypothetical protein